jgi:ribosomal protein L2
LIKRRFVSMDKKDLVATALENTKAGETAEIYLPDNTILGNVLALEYIPFGNKIAIYDIPKGTKVLKYGAEIGVSTEDIPKGSLVHVHNVKSQTVDIPPAIKEEIMRQIREKQERGA